MINYLEHHIVDHCNLNCSGCSHFSPIADPWFELLPNFIDDFTALSRKTDKQVGTIRLMGGEPLLHPHVVSFMAVTRDLFPQSDIQIVTNGLSLRNTELKKSMMKACNCYHVTICVSNYGLNLDLMDLLSGFNQVRIDGKSDMYNICLDQEGRQDPQAAFDNCDLHRYRWYYFQGGRFYPCCVAGNIQHFNRKFDWPQVPAADDISISIYDATVEEIEAFLNNPISLCRYCNTLQREQSYHPFSISQGDVSEWICQS